MNYFKLFLVALGFQMLFASLTPWKRKMVPRLLPFSTSKCLYDFIHPSFPLQKEVPFSILTQSLTYVLSPISSNFLQNLVSSTIFFLGSSVFFPYPIFPLPKIFSHHSKTRRSWRSNQSILKEINPEHSLEGLTLKLKRQYFGHLRWRANSMEKILMLGKIESRRRGLLRMIWLDGITDMSLSKFWEVVKDREDWHAAVHGATKSWTWLGDWTIAILKQAKREPFLYSVIPLENFYSS